MNPQPKPEHGACKQCIWGILKTFARKVKDNNNTEARPRVSNCIVSSGEYCNRCKAKNYPCEYIIEGMKGDAFDVFALLAWLDGVREHKVTIVGQQDPVDFFTAAEKRKLMKAALGLFNAFKYAENEHRGYHGMKDGKEKRHKIGSDAAYDTFIAAKKARLGTTILRLDPSEPQYARFAFAKQTFARKVAKEMRKDLVQKVFFKGNMPAGIIDLP